MMGRHNKLPRVILALSPNGVCNALGISRRQLQPLIDSGALSPHALGSRTLFLTSDIEAYIRSLPPPSGKKRGPKPKAKQTETIEDATP
jgi:excisionase family DNA binding protein